MLKMNTVGTGLNSVASGTAVEQSTSPYLPSTWADLHSSGAITTNNEVQFKEVVLKKYIRSNVTVRSAGTVAMYIMNAG